MTCVSTTGCDEINEAEGKGLEPPTPCGAPDFESLHNTRTLFGYPRNTLKDSMLRLGL